MKQILLVLALLALFTATTVVAQPVNAQDSSYFEQFRGMAFPTIVDKVWLWTCAKNRDMYPDSNLVLPGQVIELPTNTFYTAKPNGGQDHIWQASLYFVNEYILPYLERSTVKPIPGQSSTYKRPPQKITEESEMPWWLWIFLVVVAIMAIAWLFGKWRKPVTDSPFLATPPDLHAPDSQVLPAAEQSLRSALGRGFQIIGVPERGALNGEQTMFFAKGTHRTEHFHNEPGFRARVRFDDGTEREIVARWSCFNPVWGAKDAQFKGTFTPDNGTPQDVPVINAVQTATIARNIQRAARGEEVLAQSFALPATPAPAQPAAVASPTTVPQQPETKEDDKLHLTKLQFSHDKGLNLEGNFPMTMTELKELIGQIQGKPAETGGGEKK